MILRRQLIPKASTRLIKSLFIVHGSRPHSETRSISDLNQANPASDFLVRDSVMHYTTKVCKTLVTLTSLPYALPYLIISSCKLPDDWTLVLAQETLSQILRLLLQDFESEHQGPVVIPEEVQHRQQKRGQCIGLELHSRFVQWNENTTIPLIPLLPCR